VRFQGKKLHPNAEMGPAELRDYCRTDTAAQSLLRMTMQQLKLSARAYHRVFKLLWMIADLAGADVIGAPHSAEVVHYRSREWM
jgi:magnesium chelatase family protein